MIQMQSLGLQLGTKVLLEGANFTVYPGQKWGVIGSNGSGKTSLFKLLLGELQGDTGNLHIPKDWTLAHMAQEVAASDLSAMEYAVSGDAQLMSIREQIEGEVDGEKLASLFAELETIDGYSAESRAQRLLHGLGFPDEDTVKSVRSFSGGWRIRLNLAKALMCRSDLLLLDEPTNHLDLDATFWLEQWLKLYQGTLLIISHDRDFIDNVVDGIVSFEQKTLITYSGNYSSYEKQKAERMAQQASAFEKQQSRISEIENFVRRFRAKATKAKQAQSRLKELERMETIAPAHIDSPFDFSFPVPEKCPDQLLNFTEADIGYASKPIITNIGFSIHGNSRIGLLGHNGAGKSTLIKAITAQMPLLSGDRVESAHLKIGYFAQHQLEALDMHASCALHLQRITPSATEQSVRNFLGGFGFQGDRAFEEIEHFSGGEKARLALAILAWQKPNFLVLDEPTNHLDLEVRHALTMALQGFEGAIVVVSHDRHLLRNTVEEFWLVNNGSVSEFDGDLEDYHRWLASDAKAENSSPSELKQVTPELSKKEQRQLAAEKRERIRPLTNSIKKLEKMMNELAAKMEILEEELADPSLYEGESSKLPGLLVKQGELRAELTRTEEQWISKTEELESIQD